MMFECYQKSRTGNKISLLSKKRKRQWKNEKLF
jgi:hypothetical protein